MLADWSPMAFAFIVPLPFTTAIHLPKKALRWGDVKRSIEV